jgi:hypothetical protein
MSGTTPKPYRKRKTSSGASTPSGPNTPTTSTPGEKKNRPKPKARAAAKRARAKQEQQDALLAASNFSGNKDDFDDVPMTEDEGGDDVELMDTDGLTAGTTDIDEAMVEAQIVSITVAARLSGR